jgi:hypothetical protein
LEGLRNEQDMEQPTIDEITEIISQIKKNGCPGENQICLELVKNGGQRLLEEITELIREKMPTNWKRAVPRPIFKKEIVQVAPSTTWEE